MHIGVLGGGQLGRMLAEAGHPLGLRFTFIDPKPDACAGERGRLVCGDWHDTVVVDALSACDAVTFDFENVPADLVENLSARVRVAPGPAALMTGQDRLNEKTLFRELGIPVPMFCAVETRADLAAAIEQTGMPAVLKTRRMGYDGKGQQVLRRVEDLEMAWQALGGRELVLEQWVAFDRECSITAVRDGSGNLVCYPLTHTVHSDGMLRVARAPYRPGESLAARAEEYVAALMEHFDYVGCLTLELFQRGDELLANEFAPRVHNSVHWTIEGAVTSQFENHLRAVCGWPLGATAARGESLMLNWIGEMPPVRDFLAVPGLAWHDYGKRARAGRKVGHATLTAPDAATLKRRLATTRDRLTADMRVLLPG